MTYREHKHWNISEYVQEIPQTNPRYRQKEVLNDNSNSTVGKNTAKAQQPVVFSSGRWLQTTEKDIWYPFGGFWYTKD